MNKYKNEMDEILKVKIFDDMKVWLAQVIGIPDPSWLERELLLKERDECLGKVLVWF